MDRAGVVQFDEPGSVSPGRQAVTDPGQDWANGLRSKSPWRLRAPSNAIAIHPPDLKRVHHLDAPTLPTLPMHGKKPVCSAYIACGLPGATQRPRRPSRTAPGLAWPGTGGKRRQERRPSSEWPASPRPPALAHQPAPEPGLGLLKGQQLLPSRRCSPAVNGPLASLAGPLHLSMLTSMYSIPSIHPLPARPKKAPLRCTCCLSLAGQTARDR